MNRGRSFFFGSSFICIILLLLLFVVISCDTSDGPLGPPPAKGDSTDVKTKYAIHSAAAFSFPDPFPVRPWLQSGGYKYFFSTQSKIMYWQGPISASANSFVKVSPINIDNGVLKSYIKKGIITVGGYWGKNVYQDSLGNWHLIASPNLKRKGRPNGTIVVHLKPQKGEVWKPGAPIQNWVINKILVGAVKPAHPHNSYAAKLCTNENGILYLVYNGGQIKNNENDILARRMKSPVEVNSTYDSVVLLKPGSYNSEYRDGTSGLKLVEAANITQINHKYVMVYTVGDFAKDNYKTGLAWSDHLLGPYKKVLKKDVHNIWGNGAGKSEVQYLVQAQKPKWPNYVKDRVKGPGVGSINRGSDGKYYLFFAGYPPFSIKRANGKYKPSQRHPYFIQLNVNVPDKKVSEVSSYDLQDWITLKKVK